ncbi:MAG: hypothetical protein ACJAQ6_000860, partial [Arenicella sp.]
KNKQLKALYVDLKQEILKSLHHSMEPR